MTSNQVQKSIANDIKDARKATRLTQQEVADKADINVNYYAKIERGEAIPALLTLIRIFNAVGIKTFKVPKL